MSKLPRRQFLTGLTAAAAATASARGRSALPGAASSIDAKPALLGGQPVRTEPFPSWPVIEANDRRSWMEALESGYWTRRRGSYVETFEERWARQLGAPFVLATNSGTGALYTSLFALEVGPGDEVIVPPYTFYATFNVVLLHHALPVFADSDPETFQIDAGKIEAALSDQTRCLMPAHIGGNVADMDRILDISRRRNIPVLEDACQSHLAEWRGRKVGTLGDLGCFSFQGSKNLNSGEGGAIAGHRPELMTACASFHNVGRGHEVSADGRLEAAGPMRCAGDNRRLTEFQGALLVEQLTRLETQSRRREENAAHLTRLLQEIPGIQPAKMYPGCTRNAYHLYMFRYDSEGFAQLPRERFLEALRAEGVPSSSGYSAVNRDPYLAETLRSRAFRRIYSEKTIRDVLERSHCPVNDRLCEQGVWLTQKMLLGDREDMEQIAAAVRKIQRHAPALAASA